MADPLRQLRRAATRVAIRQAIAGSAVLPLGLYRPAIRSLTGLADAVPAVRGRVLRHMRLALGEDVPADAARRYFRHVAWMLTDSLTTFHRGIAATGLAEKIRFDDSIELLDAAVAEGLGVVLASPHWVGHELVAAVVNLRHPMAMFVRQESTPHEQEQKLQWYRALGAEVVLRPQRVSTLDDVLAYLRVLRRGGVLAITPDLLADPREGVETRLFGRPAILHGGAFALSQAARAPMIRVSGRFEADQTMTVMFDRAPSMLGAGDHDATLRAAVLDWCGWFEDKLHAAPDNWLFWLDKRWSRFLTTAPGAGAT